MPEAGYDSSKFEIDWAKNRVRCPEDKYSKFWWNQKDKRGSYIAVIFDPQDCFACKSRHLCTRSKSEKYGRQMRIHPKAQYDAQKDTRLYLESDEGRLHYNKRAGVEGTISQGVRGYGLRKTRYRGFAKTHLQHIATAAAMNLERLVAWFDDIPRGKTRISRFARLAPI